MAELKPVPYRRFVPRELLTTSAGSTYRIDYARFRADVDQILDQSIVVEEKDEFQKPPH
ncbi:MAG: hypothetical protein ACRDIU_09885 [Actinomycetota bacterium]